MYVIDGNFRGKNKRNGEWVYGKYIEQVPKDVRGWSCVGLPIVGIMVNEALPVEEVDVLTVGEYTGIKDIKGNEIYGGDIVQVLCKDDCSGGFKADVVFYYDEFLLENDMGVVDSLYNLKEYCTLEVVGNAHERRWTK